MNADSKLQTVIGKITIKQQAEAGTFTVISKTLFQYNFGERKFLIDLEKNATTEILFTNPDYNFSVELKNNSYGHLIKLNGTEIGKQHFQLKNFKADQHIAALVKELVVGPDSYQQGIMVWNNTKPGWEPVDCEDVVALIGWIKE
jgi:hypothetical protein